MTPSFGRDGIIAMTSSKTYKPVGFLRKVGAEYVAYLFRIENGFAQYGPQTTLSSKKRKDIADKAYASVRRKPMRHTELRCGLRRVASCERGRRAGGRAAGDRGRNRQLDRSRRHAGRDARHAGAVRGRKTGGVGVMTVTSNIQRRRTERDVRRSHRAIRLRGAKQPRLG
jgi:hypothetical protein